MKVKRIDAEVWKTVVDCQDYEVSNFGRVRSNKWGKTRLLRLCKNKDGYLVVHLLMNKIDKYKPVHRLVLESFRGECPNDMEASHLDGNKINNHLKNLNWETHTENVRKNSDVKLSVLKASWVRLLLGRGWRVNYLAKEFGVNHQIISKIKSNKGWVNENNKNYSR